MWAPASVHLSQLDPELLFGEGDVIAGVSARVASHWEGSILLALEPEDALRWLRAAAPGQPELEAFVELGASVLAELASSLSGRLGSGPAELVAPRLEERPTSTALLATNAPSDTEVLALRCRLSVGGTGESPAAGVSGDGVRAEGAVYLLLEPKSVLAMTSHETPAASVAEAGL